MAFGNDTFMDTCYDKYIEENYLGGTSEPITFDNFLEVWDDMPENERLALMKRAGVL
jgi:hypothetical protein